MTLAMISWIGLTGIVVVVAAVGYMDAKYQERKKEIRDEQMEFALREALVPEPTMATVSMALWEIERASLGSEVENG